MKFTKEQQENIERWNHETDLKNTAEWLKAEWLEQVGENPTKERYFKTAYYAVLEMQRQLFPKKRR